MKQSVKLVAGNWKMFGEGADLEQIRLLGEGLAASPAGCRVAVFPPATLLWRAAQLGLSNVAFGGQDCHTEEKGAFTGSISARMLADAGASMVIVGHSERRTGCGETSAMVRAKAERALSAGLEPILCIGESAEQRDAGSAVRTVCEQLKASLPDDMHGRPFAVAYEPIWAIGTGRTPTTDEIAEVKAALRGVLVDRFGDAGQTAPVLYGGSVKSDNAAEIMGIEGVCGVLVGGASLKAPDFLAIARAA